MDHEDYRKEMKAFVDHFHATMQTLIDEGKRYGLTPIAVKTDDDKGVFLLVAI